MTPLQLMLWAGVGPTLIVVGILIIAMALTYRSPADRKADWALGGLGGFCIIAGIAICYVAGHVQAGLPW